MANTTGTRGPTARDRQAEKPSRRNGFGIGAQRQLRAPQIDVAGDVVIGRHHIVRKALKGGEFTIVGQHGGKAQGVGLDALHAVADALRRAQRWLVQEHIDGKIAVIVDEVCRRAGKDNALTIVRQRRRPTVGRPQVRLGSIGVDADAGGDPGFELVNKRVVKAIGVRRDQIGGTAMKRDPAAVAGNRGLIARAIALGCARADAHSRGGPHVAIMQEHIADKVCVILDEIGSATGEHRIASIVGELHRAAVAVALHPRGVDAPTFRGRGLLIMDEDIDDIVGVTVDQVCRLAQKSDQATVARHCRHRAVGIAECS